MLSGRYVNDLAERFLYTEVPQEKIQLYPDIHEASDYLKASGSEDVYVVTCFSDREKILSTVEKEAE